MPKTDHIYGHLPGIPVFSHFNSRKDCKKYGIHTHDWHGIVGSVADGACSVVLSGGYEDDKDFGETFIYSGSGGQDEHGFQSKDQSSDSRFNRLLEVSALTKNPVRVIRGAQEDNPWSPAKGYRYDGLYVIESAYQEKGKSGFNVCKYRFRRCDDSHDSIPYRRVLTFEKLKKMERRNR